MSMLFRDAIVTKSYEEIDDSPTFTLSDTFVGTRKLKCAYSEAYELALQLKGKTVTEGENVVVYKPDVFPLNEEAVVQSVSMQDFDELKTYAILTVSYAVPDYNTDDGDEDSFASETIEPAAEFITIPNRKLYWSDGEQLKGDEAPGCLIQMLTWAYTRYRMTDIPSEVLSLVGKINDSSINSRKLGLTFPAGTLLYQPPHLQTEVTGKTEVWQVGFKFVYRPQGWNKFPRRGQSLTFESIYNSGSSQVKPYAEADFSPLFRVIV
jgi:hypothetical protein